AGFPSPADDHLEKTLSLNELLVRHPAATFMMRVEGDSMINAGIQDGDILIVDRALTAEHNSIVVALLNGEFMVKRLKMRGGRGVPVVVLSNNDGCVIARSEEAKALGIEMGTPEFQMRELCRRNQVRVFSSNYTLYGDMSARVMQILTAEAPRAEVYSIDECF